MLRSYIVKQKDANNLFTWAKKQDFMGRWMPEPLELRDIFLREIPNALPYQKQYASGKKRWIKVEDKKRKTTTFKVMQTAEEYHWGGGESDCSIDDGLCIHIPPKEIINEMGLRQSKDPGKFVDKTGKIVAQDPSVTSPGSGVLLLKKEPFLELLKKNKYEIVWAISGEKLLLGGTGGGDGFLGRLEMGGAFRMKADGKIIGKGYSKFLPPHKG